MLLRGRLGRVPAAAATSPAEPPPKPAGPRKQRPRAQRPAATPARSSCVEREIARIEERVTELERKLAEDWTNVDLVVGAPRRPRTT